MPSAHRFLCLCPPAPTPRLHGVQHLQVSIYPAAHTGPECGHNRLRPPLHPWPWGSAWHTADLNTHWLVSEEGRSTPAPKPPSGAGRRRPRPGGPHARTALPQRTAQTDAGPSRAGGGSPNPSGKRPGPLRQAVIRRGVGWVGLLLQARAPQRPGSCSGESGARGRERGRDPEAAVAAALGRSGGKVRDPGTPGRATQPPRAVCPRGGSLPVEAHRGPL